MRSVSLLNLVKVVVIGLDPNWGRVMMVFGKSGAQVDETKIDLFVNGVCIMEFGSLILFHKDVVVLLMCGFEVIFKL